MAHDCLEEQTLAVVLDRLQRLAQVTEQIDERLRRSERKTGRGKWSSQEPRPIFRGIEGRVLTQGEYEQIRAEEGMLSPQEKRR